MVEMEVKAKGPRTPSRLVVHLLQIVPCLRHTRSEHDWYMNLLGDDAVPKKTFNVHGGLTMEVCMAQFWSAQGNIILNHSLILIN
jgi:tripeptidyl-peptidase-2